jgi:hypothetical protein
MNKKILIGSIIAVAILVLVSFTGVVGYQTTKSSTIAKASPLFNIRTQRAINRESRDFTCDYVGKSKEIIIPLSQPDKRIKIIFKFIESISKMDENTFNKFIDYGIDYITNDNKIKNKYIAEILFSFRYIRSNPEDMKMYIINENGELDSKIELKQQQYTIDEEWMPGCLLALIVYMLFIYPILIVFIALSALRDCFHSIGTESGCCPCFRPQNDLLLYANEII